MSNEPFSTQKKNVFPLLLYKEVIQSHEIKFSKTPTSENELVLEVSMNVEKSQKVQMTKSFKRDNEVNFNFMHDMLW